MSQQHGRYRSYLLRLWRMISDDAPTWRISIENVLTRQRYTFTTLPDLVAFLEASGGERSEDNSSTTSEH